MKDRSKLVKKRIVDKTGKQTSVWVNLNKEIKTKKKMSDSDKSDKVKKIETINKEFTKNDFKYHVLEGITNVLPVKVEQITDNKGGSRFRIGGSDYDLKKKNITVQKVGKYGAIYDAPRTRWYIELVDGDDRENLLSLNEVDYMPNTKEDLIRSINNQMVTKYIYSKAKRVKAYSMKELEEAFDGLKPEVQIQKLKEVIERMTKYNESRDEAFALVNGHIIIPSLSKIMVMNHEEYKELTGQNKGLMITLPKK